VVLDVEPILARADGRVVGRPDIAAAAGGPGRGRRSSDEAFDRWLHDGGAGRRARWRGLSIADGLAAVRAVGARASLAHPHQHGDKRKPAICGAIHGDGLDGVEACYGRYDPGERDRWLRVADQLGLVATGGSDWHGEPAGEVAVEIPEERGKALLAWLGRG
jgi:predicted metal-dependent phosphoesterase TrpH